MPQEDGMEAREQNPRPSFEDIYMKLALSMAERSTCRRLQVGCVITSPDFRKVLAVGYNGSSSGGKNDCDSDEPGKCGCLHAEENAAINCDVVRSTEKIVFCTHLPCLMCAKRLINLGGVVQILYETDYRIKDSVALLDKAGISLTQFSGEEMRWEARKKTCEHVFTSRYNCKDCGELGAP